MNVIRRFFILLLACVPALAATPATVSQITLRTKAELSAFTVYDWQTNLTAVVHEGGNRLYYFVPGSAAVADGDLILSATGVVGQWVVDPTSLVGGGTGSSTPAPAAKNLAVQRYVDNVAALASEGTTGPGIIGTLGFATAGDGGDGVYIQLPAATYTTNGWVVDGTGCQWADNEWLMKRWHNVRRVGAVGDGVTDDYAAISNVLAQVNIHGGTAYFPKGIYRQATTLSFLSMTNTAGFSIVGDGPENTEIFGDFWNTETPEYHRLWRWKANGGTDTGSVIGPRVYGLYMHGNTEVGSTNLPHRLLAFSRAGSQSGLTIENCKFSHSANGALELGGANLRNTVLRNIYIHDDATNTALAREGSGCIGWGGTGIHASSIVTTNVACDPPDANGMHAFYWTGTGVVIDGWVSYGLFGDGPGRISNAQIKNVRMYDVGTGLTISIPSSNIVISGVEMYGPSKLTLSSTVKAVVSDVIVRGHTNVQTSAAGVSYTNTTWLQLTSGNSQDLRFENLDVEWNGGVFATILGTTNINFANCRLVGPSSVRAITQSRCLGLTVENCYIDILGGNQESFISSGSAVEVNDNVLSHGNTYVWRASNQMSPAEARNTSSTNWAFYGDTFVAPAASVINWQGRSATFFTNFVYRDRKWVLSTGVYADNRVANGSPVGFVTGSFGNEWKDFSTGARYMRTAGLGGSTNWYQVLPFFGTSATAPASTEIYPGAQWISNAVQPYIWSGTAWIPFGTP